MKNLPFVLLGLLPVAGAAADEPSLAFPDQKIGVPSLSLSATGQPGPLPVLNEAGAWFRNRGPSVLSPNKFVSKMPILTRRFDLDSKMVKTPDLAVDYKLIVKTPNVVSVK